MQRNDIML